MEPQTIAIKVQEITIKLKEAIAKAAEETNKARLFQERKDEILLEIDKVSFVVDTLMLENNYEELDKALNYVESLRINIPVWEGHGIDYNHALAVES